MLLLKVDHVISLFPSSHFLKVQQALSDMFDAQLVCQLYARWVLKDGDGLSDIPFLFAFTLQHFLEIHSKCLVLAVEVDQRIDQRRCHNSFFDIVVGWLSELLWVLSVVENIIVDLESDAKVSPEVKKPSLSFDIKLINDPKTPEII